MLLQPTIWTDWLLNWYEQNKRSLPWRTTQDPYKIWLSEIILQQTRVAQGLPYYQKFIKTFPSIQDLARASEEKVLHLWQGLGYYSRARRLHACSKYVVNKLQGKFPTTYQQLILLPGIGDYTAAAIASIAFKQSVPVLDGNVYRVLARLFGIKADRHTSSGKKEFHTLAHKIIPTHAPDLYNQAIMEFGALHCTPHKPTCHTCPLQSICYAYNTQTQNLLPIKKPKKKLKNRYLHYIIIHFKTYTYLKKRTQKDIWKGLYDFYLIEKDTLLPFDQLQDDPLVSLIKKLSIKIEQSNYMPIHQLTHQRLHTRFFHIYAKKNFIQQAKIYFEKDSLQPYQNINELPMPVLIQRFFQKTKKA